MEAITVQIWRQEKIWLIFESDSVEGKGDYWGCRIEGGNELNPPLKNRGIEVRPMSRVGTMRVQGGREGSVNRIYTPLDPVRAGRPDTGKPYVIFYSAHFSDKPGIISSSGRRLCNTLNRLDQVLHLSDNFSPPSSSQIHLFVIGAYLSYLSPLHHPPLIHTYLPLVLMYPFPYFEEIAPMTPVAAVGNSSMFSLAVTGGDSGMGEWR